MAPKLAMKTTGKTKTKFKISLATKFKISLGRRLRRLRRAAAPGAAGGWSRPSGSEGPWITLEALLAQWGPAEEAAEMDREWAEEAADLEEVAEEEREAWLEEHCAAAAAVRAEMEAEMEAEEGRRRY